MNREELALKVGVQFEEAVELFSEETLNSMLMVNVIGGISADETNNCDGGYCKNCSQCWFCGWNIIQCSDSPAM
jgi:hypothetical protein